MSGVGPHLPDDVLVIQPGTTQTGSLQVTQSPRKSSLRLPNCRIITRLTGNDSPMILSEFCVDQSCVILAIRHFLGATSCSNNNAELTGFAEARRWICFFIPRGEKVRFCSDSKHAARVTIGVDHARRNIASARQCIAVLLRSKCLFSVSRFIMFLAMRVIPGLGAVAPPVGGNRTAALLRGLFNPRARWGKDEKNEGRDDGEMLASWEKDVAQYRVAAGADLREVRMATMMEYAAAPPL